MARVSGQRITVTVFSDWKSSPYFATAWDMLTRHCGTDPREYAPAFRERDEVVGWFEAADLTLTRIELIEAIVSLPPMADYLPDHLRAVPFAEKFFKLDDTAQAEAVRFVDRGLSDYQTAEGLKVPFRSHLATTIP